MEITRSSFRPATPEDAPLLAELVNYAGEGLPLYLWSKLAGPGETALDVGRTRAARDEGAFSWTNATIIEHERQPVGCLIGYDIPDHPEPIPADFPPMFVPLQELENLAPGTWYVNVLAILPEHRASGLGSALLQLAEQKAKAIGVHGMSVIVSDTNTGARALYERMGYHEKATRPMIKDGWVNPGHNWVLLTKGI